MLNAQECGSLAKLNCIIISSSSTVIDSKKLLHLLQNQARFCTWTQPHSSFFPRLVYISEMAASSRLQMISFWSEMMATLSSPELTSHRPAPASTTPSWTAAWSPPDWWTRDIDILISTTLTPNLPTLPKLVSPLHAPRPGPGEADQAEHGDRFSGQHLGYQLQGQHLQDPVRDSVTRWRPHLYTATGKSIKK